MMLTASTVSVLATSLALMAAPAMAFYGQIADNVVQTGESYNPVLTLTDYDTGSTYSCGVVYVSSCSYEGQCPV